MGEGDSEDGHEFSRCDMDILWPGGRGHGHSINPRTGLQAEV